MHTVLFYVQHDNEVPVLVPIDVLSREPDSHGNLALVEPMKVKDEVVDSVPLTRCYEYDPYLAHAVQAYAAQVSTLVRVSQSVIEGLAVPMVPAGPANGRRLLGDARIH